MVRLEVLFLADNWGFISAQKMPEIRSQLIEEGASFAKAFVNHLACCPSRASIFTGL